MCYWWMGRNLVMMDWTKTIFDSETKHGHDGWEWNAIMMDKPEIEQNVVMLCICIWKTAMIDEKEICHDRRHWTALEMYDETENG